jgi:ribosomal protein S4
LTASPLTIAQKVRATWNKYNLYNLWRLREQYTPPKTFYQQKWEAKSMTRAYHGEHLREKQWQRMFSPRSSAVVSLSPDYLAENDGSENAAGRGSGKDHPRSSPWDKVTKAKYFPFMHMTYAPIERRLDMAVWRAMFASSARQARQFVIHGMVKVNGKKVMLAI